MTKTEVLQRIREIRMVPIIRAHSTEAALRALEAIVEGGIPCAEITMTVPGAIGGLEQAAARFGGDVLLGAGTVLDPETARACILAGAEFLVTPALNVKTIEMAHRYSKAIFPGALTPTEVLTAWDAGADAIKVFPANAVGGPRYIKALRGPFPHIEFVPTGGVNLDTVCEFLDAGCCAVGVGSDLIDQKTIAEGRFDVFAERARQFCAKIRSRSQKQPVPA
ncbi:MAG: bifunctional 4-hydroxy-2-oxoglutarate aldolase/2-dehydro-3-deoxy-phosphogluconate aldolase [Bryobacteraceae bacterium]